VIGTFLVFIAMMFLNSAHSRGFTESKRVGGEIHIEYIPPEKVIMNTILSGSAGALATMSLKGFILPNSGNFALYNTGAVCNGLIAGLVAVTAGIKHMEQWEAAFVGTLGGINYLLGCRLFQRFRIDDPLESSQVFGFGGFAGIFFAGLFDRENGLFYADKGGFKQIGVQLIGACAMIAYSVLVSSIAFFMIKKTGQLRVKRFYEIVGLDALVHGQILNQSLGKYSQVT
jgi:Amt family ammonium transporter